MPSRTPRARVIVPLSNSAKALSRESSRRANSSALAESCACFVASSSVQSRKRIDIMPMASESHVSMTGPWSLVLSNSAFIIAQCTADPRDQNLCPKANRGFSMKIKHTEHIAIAVKSMAQSRKIFEEKLGFKLEYEECLPQPSRLALMGNTCDEVDTAEKWNHAQPRISPASSNGTHSPRDRQ